MVRMITLCMQGSTPLMVACRENHPKAAKELLLHNPNLNVTDQKVSPASFVMLPHVSYTIVASALELRSNSFQRIASKLVLWLCLFGS